MTKRPDRLVAGIMGWPVSHSLSPKLHGHWISEHKLDASYIPFAVKPENLERGLKALPALGLCGVNLTIPHKEAALRLVDEIDAAAKAIGAINTIVVTANGSLSGRNTDAYGFAAGLADGGVQKPTHRDETAIVLGAGGAARAICFALYQFGYRNLFLFNRTRDRAEQLAEDFSAMPELKVQIGDWGSWSNFPQSTTLLVNSTALGMVGQASLEIDLIKLNPQATVCDAVYRPLITPLLASAAARGHKTIDGLGMLMHQAVPAFEAWFGIKPNVTTALRNTLLNALESD